MDSPDAWLLPGEQTLWTGRPARAGTTITQAGGALYATAILIIMTIAWPNIWHTMPGIVQVVFLVTWGVGVLQVVGLLVNLFVIMPRTRRRTVYEVTNYRIVVTSGQRASSVYLDQTDEPVVQGNRYGTSDLLLRAQPPGGGLAGGGLAGMFRQRGFGLATFDTVTKLPALTDADNVCQVIASARQRMIDHEIDAPFPPTCSADTDPPPGVSLGPGERVLWTGRARRIPWWFGANDMYFSAFGLLWLGMCAGMGVLVTQQGSAASLAFPIPVSLVGVYLTAGRAVLRRLRIRRSRYALTTHRLITTWRPLRGSTPVVVQESLSALLPPSVRGGSIFTGRASADPDRQLNGYKELTWPATTVAPPAFIGLADPQQVCELIGAAQLAGRVPS